MSCVLFCKQKTAYDMRISHWSSDVCSSDLTPPPPLKVAPSASMTELIWSVTEPAAALAAFFAAPLLPKRLVPSTPSVAEMVAPPCLVRSEEHTSELQSLMRISYAVFCLKKKKKQNTKQ